jgi:nucleoside-diphosphate-sugar epimerase
MNRSSKTVLVTGASGFMGQALVKTLLQDNWQVHALVRKMHGHLFPDSPNLSWHIGDIRDAEAVASAMRGCSYVFHTAALTTAWEENWDAMHSTNVKGTENVFKAALAHGIKRVVLTSSCSVAGPTANLALTEDDPRMEHFDLHYEVTKKIGEDIAEAYQRKGLDIVIVRPSKIFGEGYPSHNISLNKLMINFLQFGFIPLPCGRELKMSVVFLEDVVKGHLKAMMESEANQKYFLAGHIVTQREFFEITAKVAGSKAFVLPLPKWAMIMMGYGMALKGKLLPGAAPFKASTIRHMFRSYQFSSSKAQATLAWEITPLEESIRRTLAFLDKKPILLNQPNLHSKINYYELG